MQGMSKARLGIALALVVAAFLGYYFNTSVNPLTGESQHVGGISIQDEIQLGLHARDEMASQFGGLDPDPRINELVDRIGAQLVATATVQKSSWKYEFHVLDDPETINAFALPGGQIFITEGLLHELTTEGQIAGVLGHEVGHVLERHGAEHMAKAQLTQGLTGAAVIATGDYRTAQMAQVIGALVNMKYGRNDELESDRWGVRLTAEAGYDPSSMIKVMEILKEAGGGRSQPEFFSTHPNPDNRIDKIKQEIAKQFPGGLPPGLVK